MMGLPSITEQLGIKFDPKNLTPTKIDWTPSIGVSSIAFYQLKDSTILIISMTSLTKNGNDPRCHLS